MAAAPPPSREEVVECSQGLEEVSGKTGGAENDGTIEDSQEISYEDLPSTQVLFDGDESSNQSGVSETAEDLPELLK